MKIFYFLPKLESCGPANVVLNNIRELVALKNNIDIAIITYRTNSQNDDFKDTFEKLGITEFYSLDKIKNPLKKLSYLRRITKDGEIVHSNGFFPDLYTSMLSDHLVKVSTAHSIISKDYPATYGTLKGSFYALLHHLVYLNPSFDSIIACSDEVKHHIKKYSIFNREKVSTIHNGINQKYFNKLNLKERAALKEKIFKSLSISSGEGAKVFVYSGRLTRLKRVPELIEWFLKLPSNNNILIVLGDGDEREECIEIAKNSKNIFFLGFVNQTTPYYQIADYIVSNSSLEGFPMSILEGMSCGCTAILSDIPAHREVIKYFPNMSMFLSAYLTEVVNFNFSDKEFSYLSSERMSKEYLSIYKAQLARRI